MRSILLKAILFHVILIVLLFIAERYDTGFVIPFDFILMNLLIWMSVFLTFLCLAFISERKMKYTISYPATIFTGAVTAAMCTWYIVKFPRGENSVSPVFFGVCIVAIIFLILNSLHKVRKVQN